MAKNVLKKFRCGEKEKTIIDKLVEKTNCENESELFRSLIRKAGSHILKDVDEGYFKEKNKYKVRGEYKMFQLVIQNLNEPGDRICIELLDKGGIIKMADFEIEVSEEK
ncbi:MAG: hypothetical protein ACOCTK_02070 [Candidatus Saliniplasma sp.]